MAYFYYATLAWNSTGVDSNLWMTIETTRSWAHMNLGAGFGRTPGADEHLVADNSKGFSVYEDEHRGRWWVDAISERALQMTGDFGACRPEFVETLEQTRIWAILGDPMPQGMKAMMTYLGQGIVVIPVLVGPSDLPMLVQGLRHMRNLEGFAVTVPHKIAMVPLCDEVSAAALAVGNAGAVNIVRRKPDGCMLGHNLDGPSFLAGLIGAGITVAGRSVYIVGAGGAANAIAFALAEAGVSSLTLANRTASRSVDLAERLARAFPNVLTRLGAEDPSGHDIVVNATSSGLKHDDPLPFDVARLQSEQIVADVLVTPAMSPILAGARVRGCRIHEGHRMMEAQLDLMAKFLGAR